MKLLQAIKKAKAILSAIKLTQEPLVDKTIIQYDTDQLTEGEVVYLCDGSGDWSVLPDGLYQTLSGIKFVITDGVITSIDKQGYVAPQAEPNPKPQAISQAADDLDNDNPGKNDGKPKATIKPQQEELDEEMSEDAKDKDGKPKYGDVKYADNGLQKDKKKRYPIDTAEHIRAAWNYINKDKNAGLYSPENLKTVKDNIVAAWKDKIDKAGPPSAQKNSMEKSPELIAAEAEVARLTKIDEDAAALKLASDVVAPPAAGAPDDLLHPAPAADSEYSKLKADHEALAEKHNKLAEDHAAICAKVDALASKFDEMGKAFKAASDDVVLKATAIKTLQAQVLVLSKVPAGNPAEEIKGQMNIDPALKETMAYKIFNNK